MITLELTVIISGYVACFLVGEVLHRRQVPVWVTRNIVHVGAGLLTVIMPNVTNLGTALIVGGCGAAIVFALGLLGRLPSLYDQEQSKLGPVFFPLGLVALAALFWNADLEAFRIGALVLTLADSGAAAIGHFAGRRPYRISGRKTLEGSLAFFLITFFLAVGFLPFSALGLMSALAFATAVTVVEGSLSNGFDNLVLPNMAALLFIVMR